MNTTRPSGFGGWLRRRRESAGLTRDDLAGRASLTADAVAAIERGTSAASLASARAIADALGLTPAERAEVLALLRPIDVEADTTGIGAAPVALIGRSRELAEVMALLRHGPSRLVTLTGPGGVGKTTLALEVVRALAAEDGPDTVVVPLESLDDPSLVLRRIAERAGLTGLARGTERDALVRLIDSRHALLVLDNAEHLLAAAADISPLLASCPNLRVLVTSRAPLRLRGEREYPVGPLAVPEGTPGDLGTVDAVQLFLDRATASMPSFALTAANAPAVAAICRRLDGLPLALELAAARLRVLSPAELLVRLDRSLPLLTGGARDLPERQRTIRQAIDWSYRLLQPREQRVLRALSAFSGGFDTAAASAVAASGVAADAVTGDAPETLEALALLVEHSLVVVEPSRDADSDDTVRYRLLETIRQFAAEDLVRTGEAPTVRQRHLEWYRDLAERFDGDVAGPMQARLLRVLERDHGNHRAAMTWALEAGDPASRLDGLRTAAALWGYWYVRGAIAEGAGWLRRLLEGTDPPPRVHAAALFAQGMMLRVLGEIDAGDAGQTFEAALEQATVAGDRRLIALAQHGLGDVYRTRGELEASAHWYRLSQEGFERVEDWPWVGITLNTLAFIAMRLGDLDRAETLAQQGLEILGRDAAERHIAESGAIIGLIAIERGDVRRAASEFGQALTTFWTIQERLYVLQMIVRIAGIGVGRGHAASATRLAGAVTATYTALLQSGASRLQADLRESIEAPARTTLGETYERIWQEGQVMPLERAVNEAVALAHELSAAPTPARTSTLPAGLSAREVEVIRLVAAGHTNAVVADRLFLSRRTVDAHMRRIYDKLGLDSRAEVVRFAIDQGLA